ncbi:probable low-specificity L-threonine aldolase 2 [Contarinia nasturtii]|uniref:probable low-specificity L-threonine aldolase 2 n=1 Tax=Contarinia nasturtii TaxID=265458 RepID=UPI0012D4A670|nr:probable low-specificity L-threonine aldolase 2 [Contarinia nasturtii]
MCTPKETIIDLRSDTLSQPTDEMRVAMANAVVGDDVYGEDPTVQELEQKCAELFQKEAGLFVCSGTMGNLISIMCHCQYRGSEAIVGQSSHVFLYEQAGASTIANVSMNTIPNNDDGTYSLDEFQKRIRGSDSHEPITSLAIVENTHNICGGKVIPLEWIDELASICKDNNIKMHMDGARIFHAAEYLNVPVARITRDFDSVTFCLSKSLCAPVGSVLMGSNEFIRMARRYRKALGGGMRQVGILAAAGLVALNQIVPRIGDVHEHTKQIAQAIYDMKSPYLTVDIDTVQSNICMIHFLQPKKYSAQYFVERLNRVTSKELSDGITDKFGNGIIVKVMARDEWNCIRYVTYFHINGEMTELAIKKIKYCITELD